VEWAQHVGAVVIATAGSEDKRALLRARGVEWVTDSRSDKFVEDVLSWTDGEGVDLVLNSLSGDFIDKSLGLLRPYGRFVELGKRDYYANRPLGLRPFLQSLSLSLVDIHAMMTDRPESGARAPG
jgi:polyketide synthase 12/epothilone polyketide synthase D